MELNPIIRGWANYFRCSSGWTKAKNVIGHYMWRLQYKWAITKHKGKKIPGKRKLVNKYFKSVQWRKTYFSNWTFFGIAKEAEIWAVDIQEIKVKRQSFLRFNPSPNPYNPDDQKVMDTKMKKLAKQDIRLTKLKQKLLARQDGICPICEQLLSWKSDQIETDHITPRAEGGKDKISNLRAIHRECHLQKTNMERKLRAALKKSQLEIERLEEKKRIKKNRNKTR
jgi:RNA-directed DNA polymerase